MFSLGLQPKKLASLRLGAGNRHFKQVPLRESKPLEVEAISLLLRKQNITYFFLHRVPHL